MGLLTHHQAKCVLAGVFGARYRHSHLTMSSLSCQPGLSLAVTGTVGKDGWTPRTQLSGT